MAPPLPSLCCRCHFIELTSDAHNVEAAVDVDGAAGDAAAKVAAQEDRCVAKLGGVGGTAQWRALRRDLEHACEAADAACREGTDRSRGDGVDAHTQGPKIVRQVTYLGLQRRRR